MRLSDLDLETVSAPGRRAVPLAPVIVREVEDSDLARIATDRGTQPVRLKKIGERHHALARLLAAGTPPGEAAAIMNLQPAWVSSLQSDPAFVELITLYREKVDTAFVDTLDHIAGLSRDTVVELRDRLETDPEAFSNNQLLDLFKTMADRSGHGPTSTQVNINADLAGRLDAARQRAKEQRLAALRDITPEEGT